MTGLLNAMIGLGPGFRYSVTIGNSGTSYGFNDSTPIGSVSPAATYLGVTIRVIVAETSGSTFTFTLNGTRAQSLFAGLEILKTDGTFLRLYTNSTSFFDSSGGIVTIWQWSASGVWTSTSPSPRAVRVF